MKRMRRIWSLSPWMLVIYFKVVIAGLRIKWISFFQDSLFKSKWDSDPKEDRLGECLIEFGSLRGSLIDSRICS